MSHPFPRHKKGACTAAAVSIRAAHRSFSSTFTSSKPPHPRCTHTTHTCTHPTSITKGPNLSHQQSAFMGPLNHFSCLQCLKKDVNYVCDKTSDNISKLLSKCKLKHMEGQRPRFKFSRFPNFPLFEASGNTFTYTISETNVDPSTAS